MSSGIWVPSGSPGSAVGALRRSAGVPSDTMGRDGDFCLDYTNWKMYGPKSGGTWGTPASLTGGIELGYSQITANDTQTGVGNHDVTGLSVTVTVGTRPIKVIFDCGGGGNSGAGTTLITILEDNVQVALINLGVANVSTPTHREVRRAPSAGSHTYKINLNQFSAGNSTIAAAANSPAFIQVIEL